MYVENNKFLTDHDLYTDGASSKGAGGWSWVLVCGDKLLNCDSDGEPGASNNQMELTGVIAGLDTNYYLPLTITSDSAYVVNCFRDGWYKRWRKNDWYGSSGKPVANRELWEELLWLYEERIKGNVGTYFKHIRGHQGNKWNEEADRLAVIAKQALNIDKKPLVR